MERKSGRGTRRVPATKIGFNPTRSSIRWAGGVLAIWLLISSCGLIRTTRVGETQTEAQTVELGSAEEARIRIELAVGELSISGGAAELMDGTFRYNVEDLQPQVNYAVNDSRGELVVDQQDGNISIPVGEELISQWTLQLNNAVPIDLQIHTAAGESELDLRGLDLTGLRIDVSAGTAVVDLSSALDHDLNARITGGVGELTIRLPEEMGVRVSADAAIGGLTNSGLTQDGDVYVNAAYGSSPHTLSLDVQTGLGSITLLAP
jgi:hypothetical protein